MVVIPAGYPRVRRSARLFLGSTLGMAGEISAGAEVAIRELTALSRISTFFLFFFERELNNGLMSDFYPSL